MSLGDDRSGNMAVVIPFGGVCGKGRADRSGTAAGGQQGMRQGKTFLKDEEITACW